MRLMLFSNMHNGVRLRLSRPLTHRCDKAGMVQLQLQLRRPVDTELLKRQIHRRAAPKQTSEII